jgi:hypothetical protein
LFLAPLLSFFNTQGLLSKKGAVRTNWNKRYFVLKPPYLMYYKDKKAFEQSIGTSSATNCLGGLKLTAEAFTQALSLPTA